MPKRKASQETAEAVPAEPRRRSNRLQKLEDDESEVASSKETNKPTNPPTKKNANNSDHAVKKETSKIEDEPPAKKSRSGKQEVAAAGATEQTPATVKKAIPKKDLSASSSSSSSAITTSAPTSQERNYWLLKAEPESRFENGVDVKFSIDDLAAKTEPEPWDGIRNYAARNNLRAMKKGDLAFFYHSNCKEPGIVGIMEIVKEHSPDLSAHNPKAPYFDPKSSPQDPKWSVVHVKFHEKFKVPIGLKELKEMGAKGMPLENMQMIRQSRLSVSKVGREEWEFLIKIAEDKAKKE